MKRVAIRIECKENNLLKECLGPETNRTIPRTRVRIHEKGKVLNIDIEALDVNALRAAINSYLRWVSLGMEAATLGSVNGDH